MSGGRRAVRVRIAGRVQGVGFRWYAARRAQALGLSGWVRNAADGSVEVAASGNMDEVEQLLAALRQGPPHAMVQSVEVSELSDAQVATNADFEILP